MHDVRHISIYIARRPAEVYEFASDPRNLPRWAAGLARAEVRRDGDEWVADAPFGKVRVRFVEPNAFGVMDHDVKLESGVTVRNPMRVVANGAGSELVFTLIRQPGMSDEQLARDGEAVESDLRTLKGVLEHTERLFAYGTLQLEAVQTATFGRQLTGTRDALPGFDLAPLEIQDEAVIAVSGKAQHTMARFTGRPSDVIPGTVFAVSPEEIQSADRYEVAAVKRVAVVLQSGARAWVYADARYSPAG
jgi:uncharacterized protein YndB with AHSA1/START domain